MAKIEMDVSEYEAMKDNKRLLEETLKRERDLKADYDHLMQEKVQMAEKASKQVTIINRKVIEDVALLEDFEAMRLKIALRSVVAGTNGLTDSVFLGGIGSHHANQLRDALFRRKTKETELPPEITFKGLDEVKSQIREVLEEELDEEVKNTLKNYKKVCKENKELLESNKEYLKENTRLDKAEVKYLKTFNELNEELSNLEDELSKTREKSLDNNIIIDDIRMKLEVLNPFNKGKVLKEIKKILAQTK